MNSRRTIYTATLVTVAMSFVGMAQAQTQTLNITENSSISLTATLNGVPLTVQITPGFSSDDWVISSPGIDGQSAWQEPGETTFNFVQGQPSFNRIIVRSDFDIPGATGLPNGTPVTSSFTINGSPLTVTFHDLGDTPSPVPDTATTLELLALSLAALGMAKARASTASPSV